MATRIDYRVGTVKKVLLIETKRVLRQTLQLLEKEMKTEYSVYRVDKISKVD